MLDRLSVVVRPRPPLEALDLGFSLLRAHLRPVYTAWLALLLPLVLLAFTALPRAPWAAALVLWWLLPLLDRVVLHMLAKATFGERPSLGQSLGALPRLLQQGAMASLLWRRFSPWRPLLLPLWQLEGQRGPGYRQRSRQLLRFAMAPSALLTAGFTAFSGILLVALLGLVELLTPEGSGFDLETLLLRSPWPLWLQRTASLAAFLSVALLEPFCVAGGFALYLNRRTQLEGWDLELAFRSLASRARLALKGTLLVLVCLAPLRAQVPPPPRQALEEVLRAPEFQRERTEHRLRWKLTPPRSRTPRQIPGWLLAMAFVLAPLSKVLVILGLVALVPALLWRGRHRLGQMMSRPAPQRLLPLRSGPEGRAESLPEDPATEARALWARGAVREALALLYRASLAELARRRGAPAPRGATEAACLGLVKEVMDPASAACFAHLTHLWEETAYGAQVPRVDGSALCDGWARHFAHTGGRT